MKRRGLALHSDGAERLRKAKLQRNLTNMGLSEAAGLSERTVKRVLAGEKAETYTVFLICKALGMKFSDVIEKEEWDERIQPSFNSPLSAVATEQGMERLNTQMKKAGQDWDSLSAACGVSALGISRFFRGWPLGKTSVFHLCRALELSPEQVVGKSWDPSFKPREKQVSKRTIVGALGVGDCFLAESCGGARLYEVCSVNRRQRWCKEVGNQNAPKFSLEFNTPIVRINPDALPVIGFNN